MLTSIMEELNITQGMIEDIIFIGCALIFLFLLTCFIDAGKSNKAVEVYKEKFMRIFSIQKDIRGTMLEVLNEYNDNTKEAKALKAGIHYLDHSIMRDYAGAFHFIETYLNDESVKKMHADCINEAQKLKLSMITKKIS